MSIVMALDGVQLSLLYTVHNVVINRVTDGNFPCPNS